MYKCAAFLILLFPKESRFMLSNLLKLRRKLYDKNILKVIRIPEPVISVGNISVGGSGKTSMVYFLAKWLEEKGKKTAILSRGYGKLKDGCVGTKNNFFDDEAFIIKGLAHTQRFTAPNRAKLALELSQTNEFDAFILDDGMQYLALKKDINILMMSSLNPFGKWHFFPFGGLREPVEFIKYSDIIILSYSNLVSYASIKETESILNAYMDSRIPILRSIHKPKGLLKVDFQDDRNEYTFREETFKAVSEKKVLAFCGIGEPISFKLLLSKYKIGKLCKFITFRDHHQYSSSDFKMIEKIADENDIEIILTTEKDLQRFVNYPWRFPCFALKVELEIISNLESLINLLENLFQKKSG